MQKGELLNLSGRNEINESVETKNTETNELPDEIRENESEDLPDEIGNDNEQELPEEIDIKEMEETGAESSSEGDAENNEKNEEYGSPIKEKQEIVDKSETHEVENPHQEEVDGKTYYYDDNGKLYRVDNELSPNTEYEINGYKYTTDERGRIISAEGKLHIKDREGRLPIKDSIEDIGKGDQKEGDDRGHLIGDQFDGSNGLENLIPQDANINRNDYKNFENELAKEVKAGKKVEVKVEPVYEGDSRRPEAIVVTYSIDGEVSVRVFPNGQEV